MSRKRELQQMLKAEAEEKRKNIHEEREKIIELVRRKPCLWDRSLEIYRNRDLADQAWQEIATEMNLKKDQCKKKWKSVFDQFRNHFHNVTRSKSGQELDDETMDSVNWPFFKTMLLLRDVVRRRDTTSNFKLSEEELDNDQSGKKNGSFSASFMGKEFDIEEEITEPVGDIGDLEDDTQASSAQSKDPSSSSCEQGESSGSQAPLMSDDARQKITIASRKHLHESMMKKKKLSGKEISSIPKSVLETLSQCNKELNKPDDSASAFGDYAASLLRDLPLSKRRKCEAEVILLIMSHIDNNE